VISRVAGASTASDSVDREQTVRSGEIRRLALAVRDGGRALKDNRAHLQAIVADMAPTLMERTGIGSVTAAQVIVNFSHVGRSQRRGLRRAVRHQPLQGSIGAHRPAPLNAVATAPMAVA
jgi:transposase